MSGEPQLTWMPCSNDQIERLGVEDVGRVDDRRRIAVRRYSRRPGPRDLARADRIDQHAVAADQVEIARFEQAFWA